MARPSRGAFTAPLPRPTRSCPGNGIFTSSPERNGRPASRPALRRAHAAQVARLHRHRGADPGARHRRKHGTLLRRQRRPPQSAAVPAPGPSRRDLRGCTRIREGAHQLPELPRLAADVEDVRVDGDLPEPGLQPDGRGAGRAAQRLHGVGGLLPHARAAGRGRPRLRGRRRSSRRRARRGSRRGGGGAPPPRRGAADDHPGAAPVAVLGGGAWIRLFGGSRSAIGMVVTLNGAPYTVIGVIPPDFTFYGPARDVYTPIGQWTDPSFRDRSIEVSAHAIGRLRPGVTPAQAKADMDAVARDLATAYPVANKNLGIRIVPMKQDITGSVRPFLLVLLAAVGFLLLIACANVANLLLARSIGRSRELALRASLGASRSRVVRQLLAESALLAGLGSVLGLLIAVWGTRAVLSVLPGALPRAGDVGIDGHVLLFTLGASLFAGFLFGLVPALKTSRVNLQDVLKDSGRGSSGARHRLQRLFVAIEVALALVLLVGAGLMIQSLQALWRVDPGFRPDHAITFTLSLASSPSTSSAETRARLRRFDDAMRAVPGVEAVSVTLGSRPMIHDTSLPSV